MASNISINSIDSDVFLSSNYQASQAHNETRSLNNLNSTTLLANHTRGMPTISSITSPEPNFVTLDDNSNDPIFPYGFEVYQPIVLPSLNSLNLPTNLFNILAAMTVVQQIPSQHDDNYSPQTPEPSESSTISTPPINLSTIDGWENRHAKLIDNTFYSEDQPRRVHWNSPMDETFRLEGKLRRIYLLPSPYLPSPPRQMKRKLEMGMNFPKNGVSQHVWDACG